MQELLFVIIRLPGITTYFIIIVTSGWKCTDRRHIKEESRSILTYPYSDPNPVPAMAVSSMASPFYPYYVFDGYTDTGNKQGVEGYLP